MEIKKLSEQKFHDKSFSHDLRSCVSNYYSVNKNARDDYMRDILKACHGSVVLEYGCGSDGSDAFTLASRGARVIGIDMSPVAVNSAKMLAKQKKIEDQVSFQLGDAEQLDFPDNFFDMVVGSGILHHLDLVKAFDCLCRVLKPSGKAIFMEPLGHNFFINAFRRMTPSIRTKDEHPLLMRDLKVVKKYFHSTKMEFYNFMTLLAIPLFSLKSSGNLLKILFEFDRLLLSYLPAFRRMAWVVVIFASEPKKIVK